jgi:hypothetical protein
MTAEDEPPPSSPTPHSSRSSNSRSRSHDEEERPTDYIETTSRNSSNTFTFSPLGRVVQRTWTAGSPLSDASAYEIDNVDQLWQHHLEEIQAELEHVEVVVRAVTDDDDILPLQTATPTATATTTTKGEQPVVMPTVQQARTRFEKYSKQAAARQSWLKKDSLPSTTTGPKVPTLREAERTLEFLSPSSTVSSLTLFMDLTNHGKKINQSSNEPPEEPQPQQMSQFQLARKSLGFANDTSQKTSRILKPLVRRTTLSTLDNGDRNKSMTKPQPQPEWATKSLKAVRPESSKSSTRRESTAPRSSTLNVTIHKNAGVETANGEMPILETPKNEPTQQERRVSQFEWARKSLNLHRDSQKIIAPQTAPPKLRPARQSTTEVVEVEVESTQEFKSLLKAWKIVDTELSPHPTFFSPSAPPTTKQSSRAPVSATTTTKLLPPPVSACPSTSTLRSTENEDYEDAEQMRIARMVQNYQGYSLRQKPNNNSVLAMRKQFTNRYVDSDFYETTFAERGELNSALIILENNDTFQIVLGDSNTKETTQQKPARELKIRSVELVHSNHIDLGRDTCECSGSVFSGNDDLISFFLPQMGMACTCGKRKPVGFINPENPSALENVLRPWQVDFLESLGITRSDQLVKERCTNSHTLAKGLKRWRRKNDMIHFKTSSCAMAIDIWAKTAKVYTRSIRQQIDAGHELLDCQPEEVMKELSRFVGELPAAPKKRGTIALFEINLDSEMEI